MSEILGDPKRREQLGPVLDQLGDFGREASSFEHFVEFAGVIKLGCSVLAAAECLSNAV